MSTRLDKIVALATRVAETKAAHEAALSDLRAAIGEDAPEEAPRGKAHPRRPAGESREPSASPRSATPPSASEPKGRKGVILAWLRAHPGPHAISEIAVGLSDPSPKIVGIEAAKIARQGLISRAGEGRTGTYEAAP